MVKRTIAFFLAVFAGLFFDLTIPPRKVLAKFLANKVWGAELPKEEVDEEDQVECDKQCEERIGELRTKQRQITDLSFMLSKQPFPHAWHHEMPRSQRTPVRLGNDITKNPPRRLSPKQAAEAIMAVIANLPEPPPLGERTDEEAIAWDNITQVRSGAMLILEDRRPGSSSLPVMFTKKSKHHHTKR